MIVKTFVLGQLQTNCYLIEENRHCLLLDPADDSQFLADYINDQHLSLDTIILTHGHFDHCLAVSDLKLIYAAPVAASSKDNFLVQKISQSANYWQKSNQQITSFIPDIDLSKIKTLSFSDHTISIISTPGHTPGSLSLYFNDLNILFSGDTLFSDGFGRTDLSYSQPTKMSQSIKKLNSLPKNTLVYPGHGHSFLLADLL